MRTREPCTITTALRLCGRDRVERFVLRVRYDDGLEQCFGPSEVITSRRLTDFVNTLCDTFTVRRSHDLIGRRCIALRCFPDQELIEGLEDMNGRRFTLTAWRRRHEPDAPSPLECEIAKLQRLHAAAQETVAQTAVQLATLAEQYTPWE